MLLIDNITDTSMKTSTMATPANVDTGQHQSTSKVIIEYKLGKQRSPQMTKDFTQIADDVLNGIGVLRHGTPEPLKAFAALSTSATATGAVDTKTKELMALAIGIAVHCDGCVAYHTKMAHKHGATRQEIAETVALALYMGGGPAAVYGADAMRAYDQFSGAKT